LAAIGGRRSELEIETDDLFMLLGECASGAAFSVSLNYIDRVEERWIVVNTTDATYRVDLVAGTLSESGNPIELEPAALDELYLRQHLAVIAGREPCCTLAEGIAVVEMIAAAEVAAARGQWIRR
jgi:hypothetical protein